MKKEIQKLKLKDHIKKRPSMYLGSVKSKGIINLLLGLINDCISISEDDNYFIKIKLSSSHRFSVSIKASTDISNFEKISHKNLNLKVCKVLSHKFNLTKYNNRRFSLQFALDKTVFKENVNYLELAETIQLWSYLNRNSKILVTDKREKYINQNYFHFPEGVKYLYDRIVKDSLGKPEFEIHYDNLLDGLRYQIFIGHRTDWYPSYRIISFANNTHTIYGGSLIDGIIEGLIRGCKKYIKDSNLISLKIKKKKFYHGLILVASVKGYEFRYEGSNKEALLDKKVQKKTKKLIKKMTIDFLVNNEKKARNFLNRFDENEMISKMY